MWWKQTKDKDSDKSLADLGVQLLDEILQLGILLGKANISISTDNKTRQGTEQNTAMQVIMDAIVQGIDERYPDFLELDEEQQQQIITSEIEAMEEAYFATKTVKEEK